MVLKANAHLLLLIPHILWWALCKGRVLLHVVILTALSDDNNEICTAVETSLSSQVIILSYVTLGDPSDWWFEEIDISFWTPTHSTEFSLIWIVNFDRVRRPIQELLLSYCRRWWKSTFVRLLYWMSKRLKNICWTDWSFGLFRSWLIQLQYIPWRQVPKMREVHREKFSIA